MGMKHCKYYRRGIFGAPECLVHLKEMGNKTNANRTDITPSEVWRSTAVVESAFEKKVELNKWTYAGLGQKAWRQKRAAVPHFRDAGVKMALGASSEDDSLARAIATALFEGLRHAHKPSAELREKSMQLLGFVQLDSAADGAAAGGSALDEAVLKSLEQTATPQPRARASSTTARAALSACCKPAGESPCCTVATSGWLEMTPSTFARLWPWRSA